MIRDGHRLVLKLHGHGRLWQVHIAGALGAAMPFAFAIPPDGRAEARLREARDMLASTSSHQTSLVARRSSSEPIITMQSLQALDGHLAGASEREIAIAIFGLRPVRETWHSDSELRARVRYLIRRGHAGMDGGYRRLLWGSDARRAGALSASAPTAARRKPRRRVSPSAAP